MENSFLTHTTPLQLLFLFSIQLLMADHVRANAECLSVFFFLLFFGYALSSDSKYFCIIYKAIKHFCPTVYIDRYFLNIAITFVREKWGRSAERD